MCLSFSDECIFSMDESKVHDGHTENTDSSPQHLGRRKVMSASTHYSLTANASFRVTQFSRVINLKKYFSANQGFY